MKPYRLEWRPLAQEDLRGIVAYIGHDSPTRAKSFSKELREKAQTLAQYPELGRSGRPGLPPWLRELVVHRNYIIFYRVLDATRTVQILRVRHAAQNVP